MFYQLKITRKGTKPPVWRRCTVAADVTFANMAAMLEKLVQYPAEKTPVSLGDGSDSQNNENNGDEEKELLLQAYLSYIGVEEQDIQEIQKMNQQIETIILTKGASEQQSVSIETAVYFVYTTNQDKVLAVLAVDLPDKAVQYGCSEIEIVDNWKQYEVSQANAVLYSEETQEFQSLRCDTTNEYQLAISGISSAKGNTKSNAGPAETGNGAGSL